MKFLAVAILIAATGAMGQNPYEYVDDALIQKVGQIVYEYDQKVAASRGAGGNMNTNFNAPMPAARNVNYNQYQNMKPQNNYQAPATYKYNDNMNTNMNAKRVNNYAQPQQFKQDTMFQASSNQQYTKPVARSVQQPFVQHQPQTNFNQYQQQQPMYQNFRSQRQFAAPAPVQTYQQKPQAQTYQQKPQAQTYQQKPQAQTYQQKPQAQTYQPQYNQPQQKNFGSFGYTLSQPEAIPMVAEFHETMGQESGFGQDAYKIDGYSNSNNNNNKYRF